MTSKNLVLIPGSLTNKDLWCLQEDIFSIFDSVLNVDINRSASISEIASESSKEINEHSTVIAFSMGGYIALELFKYIPEKINSLIIINGSAKELPADAKKQRFKLSKMVQRGRLEEMIDLIYKQSFYNLNQKNKYLPLLKDMALKVGQESYLNQLSSMINKGDQTPILSLIQCPVLLVAGENDRIMPVERSEYLNQHISHSTLKLLPNCGHLVMLDQPEHFNQHLRNWFKQDA